MKKTTKALLIPIAAFAVTVTGASAFNSDVLQSAGLEVEQISAFERARDLHKEGDKDAARDVLLEAGVDMETMQSVRTAMKEHRQGMHEEIEAAVKEGDYAAFLVAVQNSPIAEIVDTPEEFQLFSEALELKESGNRKAARAIMEDLGFDGKMMKEKGHGMHEMHGEKGNEESEGHQMRRMKGGHDEDED